VVKWGKEDFQCVGCGNMWYAKRVGPKKYYSELSNDYKPTSKEAAASKEIGLKSTKKCPKCKAPIMWKKK